MSAATTAPSKNGHLSAKDLADLQASGLNEDMIQAARLSTWADAAKIGKALNWKGPARGLGACLAIPYLDHNGQGTDYVRFKPSTPRDNNHKYESPKDKPNRLYYPPGSTDCLQEPKFCLVVTEGEKKALCAQQHDIMCVGLSGVWNWRTRGGGGYKQAKGKSRPIPDLDNIAWKDRITYLIFDSDSAENEKVAAARNALAEELRGRGAVVVIVELPAGPVNGDGKPSKQGLDDYIVANGVEALRKLMDEARKKALVESAAEGCEKSSKKKNKNKKTEKRPSQADWLVKLATAALELWHSPEGEAFATTRGKPRQSWPLRSKAARRYLARLLYQHDGKAPNGEAIQAAINCLEGMGLFSGPKQTVFTRIGEQEGKVYIDLGDDEWRAVEISVGGWQVLDGSPVRFRRSRGLLALPVPERGGKVDDLRRFVNIGSDADWRLVVGWALATFRPTGPYPILGLHGEQGSAKSTTARALRSLIDPNIAPLRSEPKEPRDLIIAATNSWAMTLDNLSTLPPWLSDCLCRLATGGGFSTRELYTDSDEILFDAQRPVLLNGIEEVATRGDLLERAILLTLPTIPEDRRRTEAEFWREFHTAKPRILGALLDAVVVGMRNLPTVKLAKLPRMADFARWITACEPALGWESGAFLTAYRGNVRDANELALETSPITAPLRGFLCKQSDGTWTGTASELLAELVKLVPEKATKENDWPKNPRSLSGKLRRLAPNLRRSGVSVGFGRTSKASSLILESTGDVATPATPAPQPHNFQGNHDVATPPECSKSGKGVASAPEVNHCQSSKNVASGASVGKSRPSSAPGAGREVHSL